MSDVTRDLTRRIENLERQNRRLRWVGASALAILPVAGLMSFAAPAVCKTVWGERFVLRDGSGRDRMVLNAYGTKTPSLTVKDTSGENVAELGVNDEGEVSLHVFKEGRKVPAALQLGAADEKQSKSDDDSGVN